MARTRLTQRPSRTQAIDRARCDAFNAAHPVCTPILVWVGRFRDGQPVATEVAARARCDGLTEPMVLTSDHGWIALTHVFERGDRPDRRELFLDAQHIDASSAPLRIAPADAEVLRAAAASRGIDAGELARRIVEAVARDGLVDAVLDDAAQTRARRREMGCLAPAVATAGIGA